MKLAIGSDHAGFELKEYLKQILLSKGYDLTDVGTYDKSSVDYPDFGFKVAHLVSSKLADKGILVCGTGIGMSVVANKVKSVRAALAFDIYTAIQSRKHLDANILVLGGRVTGQGLAEEIVNAWLNTPFESGRHEKRIEKIAQFETEYLK
ncbi:MAG TPA: ribose 5-phosphate isomerase B [Syntrophorhabdaceae bacterium]|nr:ribose 5-phosphate isomerase B [Syntrophorhabdaceae bacterium]MDI9562239.1 ribose 5-phosphate isomerase B [Pseudomonadota bacterium]OQC49560.1 MAG: putative sugar phosphate isomerase YwlF [Deltaproteobacteria bacterium ADurb.Bin026]MBP8697932.1 ribose 5-phosphate isomerase B [Syntrophorhabdaceae bacterium]MBV6504702.1 putative sugar phosphate isomerase YwlF [Syntrophorhabdaceae bacterium]